MIAAIAAGQTDALDVERDGLDAVARVRQDDAQAGLAILGGAALSTLGLVLLALWSVRSAYRGRRATTRVAMTLLAVLACGVASGALVWTAYVAGADLGDLWDRAALLIVGSPGRGVGGSVWSGRSFPSRGGARTESKRLGGATRNGSRPVDSISRRPRPALPRHLHPEQRPRPQRTGPRPFVGWWAPERGYPARR